MNAQAQLVLLSATSTSTNIPQARYGHSLNYDKNGGFWIFGGHNSGYLSSLWRYNRTSNSFRFIDGSNATAASAVQINKPTPRGEHFNWVDNKGNLFVHGGYGYSENGATYGKFRLHL